MPDPIEDGAKLIERTAVDLEHKRAEEIAAKASKDEHLLERQALDAAIAADDAKEAAAHQGVVQDEKVIADTIGRMRSEPIPGPGPAPQPPRPLVG